MIMMPRSDVCINFHVQSLPVGLRSDQYMYEQILYGYTIVVSPSVDGDIAGSLGFEDSVPLPLSNWCH